MFKLLVLLAAIVAVWGLPHTDRFELKKFRRPIPDGRIVDGQDADIADYPYALAFLWFGHQICGASIIASKWALTAAHCCDDDDAEYSVIAGSANLTGGQVVQVAAVYQHPLFGVPRIDYDVAVLELAEYIIVENASPIALHDAGFVVEEGTAVTITGWGDLDEDGSRPDVLQVVVTEVVSNQLCNDTYEGIITDRLVCAGNFEEGGESMCNGDTGDPLVVEGKLYGIGSWGLPCAPPHYPGVFSRITEESLREFVRNITGL